MKILLAFIVAAAAAGVAVGALVATSQPPEITNGPQDQVIMGAANPASASALPAAAGHDSCCPPPAPVAVTPVAKQHDACCPPPAQGRAMPAVAQANNLTQQESQIAARLISTSATPAAPADGQKPEKASGDACCP